MSEKLNIEKVYPWIKVVENSIKGGAVTVVDSAGNRATVELPWRPWLGNLGIFFVTDVGERFEVVQSKALPDDLDIATLYNKACANLIRDVEFNFCPTVWGGAGIVCGGDFEACGICLPGLAEFLGQQFGGDFVVGVPAKDVLAAAPIDNEQAMHGLKTSVKAVMDGSDHTLTKMLYRYSVEEHRYSIYGEAY